MQKTGKKNIGGYTCFVYIKIGKIPFSLDLIFNSMSVLCCHGHLSMYFVFSSTKISLKFWTLSIKVVILPLQPKKSTTKQDMKDKSHVPVTL